MQKSKKREIVNILSEMFQKVSFIAVSEYRGLNVADFNVLRRQVRKANGNCVVVKNNLAKIAVKDSPYEKRLANAFSGSISLIYCEDDPSGVIKTLVKFCKNNDKIQLLSAATQDAEFSSAEMIQLAELPPILELRAEFYNLLSAPLSNIVGVLEASQRDLLGIISAYLDKRKD